MDSHSPRAYRLVSIAVATLAAPLATADADTNISPWTTIVHGTQSQAEQLATIDLQRYLGQVSGTVPAVLSVSQWRANPVAAVWLGTPEANALLRDGAPGSEAVGQEGYWLDEIERDGEQVVIAAGQTPTGAVNAVYGLLRALGYRFYLGSESIPASLPAGLSDGRTVRRPVLGVRGVLPWYNFFNSPTVWDATDHRAFVDQLIRLGANFVGFHTYDSEPFAAYEEDGQMKWGARLLSTGAPTWGTHPLPTSQFGFGTGAMFADEFFGAASTRETTNPDEAIRREQAIMREALDYAHNRGLKTCLGFELFGDPTEPANRDVFLKRINHILDQYPTLDFVWLWQAETQGVQGFRKSYTQHVLPSSLEAQSALPTYGAARRKAFHRIVERTAGARPFFQDNEAGKIARAIEGARLEQFAQLAYRALARREHPPRLVISGWGGDERLLSAEYYDGLDKLLPASVVFASLDHIWPRARVDTIYHELPANRERWPIPWLELDGDQWHPQPYVHTYEKMMRDIGQGGSQGALGIHWRTREVEETFSFLVDYAWNPDLTAEAFFNDLAHHCYDAAIADEMAAIHIELDRLGYRWVGGSGQAECGTFGWGPGETAKVAELQNIRQRIAALLPKIGHGRDRLEWVLHRIDWVLAFQDAQVAAVEAQALLDKAAGAEGEEAKSLARVAIKRLDDGAMPRALRAYALRVSTRGEYGVLATINTKAVVAWRGLRERCAKILDTVEPEDTSAWQPRPDILLPRQPGSLTGGQAAEFCPIVLGGKPAWIHYRTVGTATWTSGRLETLRGWVQRAAVPAKAVTQPGIEIGFSFDKSPDAEMAFGPVAVTVLPVMAVITTPRPAAPTSAPEALRVTAWEGITTTVELTWNEAIEADYFRVLRDGQPVAETAVPLFPDNPRCTEPSYVVEAWRDGTVVTRSESVRFNVPDRPITQETPVTLIANQAGVLLRWPAAASANIAWYSVDRFAAGEGAGQPERVSEIPASEIGEHVFHEKPGAGPWRYRVTPVNAAGREGPATTVDVVFPPAARTTPVLACPLDAKPADATVTGNVRFGPDGATFAGGHLAIPHRDEMNLGDGLTLTFEFKADRTDAMPVLVCHGQWQVDGWFVQILDGRLIVRTPCGDANGPQIEADRWYKVRFIFDGWRLRLAVDGQWHKDTPITAAPVPTERPLLLGQYGANQPAHAFHGTLRNVKLYADVFVEGPAEP
ncbi:MAG: hypothetical protein JXA69_18910 [Phycisphaerae bacterium]|nr:hypothetical protein [Phycisphaerae bacterium]